MAARILACRQPKSLPWQETQPSESVIVVRFGALAFFVSYWGAWRRIAVAFFKLFNAVATFCRAICHCPGAG